MPDALTLHDVTAGYPGCPPVLRGVTLSLATGESVAVIGPNGAGKSTLLRTMTGLLKPRSGEVRLFGKNIRHLPAADRARQLAVVTQELETSHPFTLYEMVMMSRMGSRARWSQPTQADKQKALWALAQADLVELHDHLFQNVSGGEQQRTAIAMALVAEPRVLLMDEPTSHLDMSHRADLMARLTSLHRDQGVTTLMVGHDLNLAAEYFPRIILMQDGRAVADGPPDEVMTAGHLEYVYHCPVSVYPDPFTGSLRVFPKR